MKRNIKNLVAGSLLSLLLLAALCGALSLSPKAPQAPPSEQPTALADDFEKIDIEEAISILP